MISPGDMPILAVFDVFGLLVLFLTLVVVGAIQIGIVIGAMYAMHRFIPDKLPEKQYGNFDFDAFVMPAFQELLVRLSIVVLGTTIVLHMLDYIFIGTLINYPWVNIVVRLSLLLLEAGGIAGGLYLLFKLDPFRLAVLTGVSAFFYFLFQFYLVKFLI